MHCTARSVPYALYNEVCALCTVQRGLYPMHCTARSVPYALYSEVQGAISNYFPTGTIVNRYNTAYTSQLCTNAMLSACTPRDIFSH